MVELHLDENGNAQGQVFIDDGKSNLNSTNNLLVDINVADNILSIIPQQDFFNLEIPKIFKILIQPIFVDVNRVTLYHKDQGKYGLACIMLTV